MQLTLIVLKLTRNRMLEIRVLARLLLYNSRSIRKINGLFAMRKFLLILILMIPFICFGQINTSGNDDSLTIRKRLYSIQKYGFPEIYSPSTRQNNIDFNRIIEFQYRENYFVPLLPPFQRINFSKLFMLDDNFTNQYILNSQNSITTSHIISNFIGLGGLTLVGGNYNYGLRDIGILSVGLYAAKYNIYNYFRNDAGINGNIKIEITDNLSLNLFGQHSYTTSKIGISPFISSLYPHSNFGGSFEFKVNNNWGFVLGTENEYDVFLRKWVTRPFIMPVFYKY